MPACGGCRSRTRREHHFSSFGSGRTHIVFERSIGGHPQIWTTSRMARQCTDAFREQQNAESGAGSKLGRAFTLCARSRLLCRGVPTSLNYHRRRSSFPPVAVVIEAEFACGAADERFRRRRSGSRGPIRSPGIPDEASEASSPLNRRFCTLVPLVVLVALVSIAGCKKKTPPPMCSETALDLFA